MKFINFLLESDTHLNYHSKLWLARSRPVNVWSQSFQHISCQADNSKWSSTGSTVLSFSPMIETKLSVPLTDRDSFCWLRQFVHFITSLHWIEAVCGEWSSFSLSFPLWSQSRPDKTQQQATQMPDKQTKPEASQSLVTTTETTAPSTNNSAASTVTSTAGVPQSATQNNKSWREREKFKIRGEIIFSG